MKQKIRVLLLLLTGFVAAVALSGCWGGKTQQGENPSNSESTVTPTKAVYGGKITVGIAQDLDKSLDPHQTAAAGTREILFNIYEGLLKPDKDGNLIPAIASKYTVSETGDTFTFVLREGVSFHDGALVTAEDVLYSLERCRGTNGKQPLIPAFAAVSSITKQDDNTIVIQLKEPDLEFPAYMTAAIIPAGSGETQEVPKGTGPFQFVSRTPQENIVLSKFEAYWGEAAYLDKITYRVIENAETMLMALQSGSIDFCAHLTWDQVQELGERVTVASGPMNLVQALYLNNNAVPFDDIRVRQALSYAVNRQEIMDILSNGEGYPLGSSMYPAFQKYFMPELTDYYGYDPAKAKELLAEAGYANGLTLTFTVPSNYKPHVDTAQIIAAQFAAIGVKVNVNLVDWSAWLSEVYQGRDYVATVVGMDANALTARAMLERFHSESPKNFINFSNREYDAVFRLALTAGTEETQIVQYRRLQEILVEQAANVYIQDLCDFIAMRQDLKGYTPYPLYVLDMAKLHFLE